MAKRNEQATKTRTVRSIRPLMYSAATPASATDHGGLLGLTDDDHAQYMHISAGRTVTAQHSFSPGAAQAPFTLGVNAQGQLVTGLNADLWDGREYSDYFDQTLKQSSWPIFNGLTLTGNMNTSGTIDGVDLANFNAVQFVVMTASGETANERVLTGGAGLTLTDGGAGSTATLAVGAGNGITVNADDVALTTPGTLTSATANSASGNHTHAITNYALSGTSNQITVTGAGKVLGAATTLSLPQNIHTAATPTFGGLTLSGDLAIDTDLLLVDVSQANIGINCLPDTQFDLDIAGNLRAQGWIVGKHAIQLSDALMICHYDGQTPYETNFTGELNGHMGQIGTPTGGVIFREGKFGKAVQVAEATTNYVTNPSFEVNITDGWNNIGTGVTYAHDTTKAHIGGASVKITAGSAVANMLGSNLSVPNGSSVTASCWVWVGTAGKTARLVIQDLDTPATVASADATSSGEWEFITCSWTNSTGGAIEVETRLQNRETDSTTIICFDEVQLELKAYPTPYCDGSLGDGHSWSGTAHASTSSRTAATLTYTQAEVLNTTQGSISAWIKPQTAKDWVWLFAASGGNGEFDCYYSDAETIVFRLDGTTLTSVTTYNPLEWTHVLVTWDATTLNLYVNGDLEATDSAAGLAPTWGTDLYIGTNYQADATTGLSLIDDFAIIERVISADEVRAIYESNAPVFAETSNFQFRATPDGLVWADNDGLWVKGSGGDAVLGVYANDSTKSWGGQTLAQGDLMIGDDTEYILWDDSAPELKIATGGGDVILDSDGLTLVAPTGARTSSTSINWYDSGSEHGYIYANSSGVLRLWGSASIRLETYTSADALATDKYIEFANAFAVPSSPATGYANAYVKGGKYIVQYNDGGTIKYHYRDLTATSDGSWIYSASAP